MRSSDKHCSVALIWQLFELKMTFISMMTVTIVSFIWTNLFQYHIFETRQEFPFHRTGLHIFAHWIISALLFMCNHCFDCCRSWISLSYFCVLTIFKNTRHFLFLSFIIIYLNYFGVNNLCFLKFYQNVFFFFYKLWSKG